MDYRADILMGWLEDLEENITPQFEKYTKKKKQNGTTQSMVGPVANNDMFEGEQVTASSIFEFDKQTP